MQARIHKASGLCAAAARHFRVPWGEGRPYARLQRGCVRLQPRYIRLQAACLDGGIELSIVRVGTLKGGGPGRAEGGIDAGLARPYYDNVRTSRTQ